LLGVVFGFVAGVVAAVVGTEEFDVVPPVVATDTVDGSVLGVAAVAFLVIGAVVVVVVVAVSFPSPLTE